MREWSRDDIWIDGDGIFLGDENRPHGVVTVEKDWWLRSGPQLNSHIVERHWFRPGIVRAYQENLSLEDQLALETEVPGVKNIGIERSVDTDAASMTLLINNQRLLPLGEIAPSGTGEGVDARGIEITARPPVLGDPGYLSHNRGQTEASEGLWGFENEQPIVYRRFGSEDLDFASYNGTFYGAVGSEDRSYEDAWDHIGNRHAQISDIGGTAGYIGNLFEYSPGFIRGAEARPVATRQGGARAFVAAGSSTVNGASATPIPDLGRPIVGVQVWAMVGHAADTLRPDLQMLWRPSLMMWDPTFGAGDPAEEDVPDPDPGAPVMFTSTTFTTTATTTNQTYINSNIYAVNPVTRDPWTLDEVNGLITGINPYTDDLTDGWGVQCVPNAGFNITNAGVGNPGVPTGDPNPAFDENEVRIYSIWLEIRVGPPTDSWAAVLMPNALLRTYQGYGDNGEGLQSNLEAGNLIKTGTWLIDEVNQKSNGELEIRCRDMAKLLITQKIYPPLVQPSEYPVLWGYNFGGTVPIANRTSPGLGGGLAGTYGPNTYGVDGDVDAVDGNFRDWTEIVKWLLLWSGWWLSPLIDIPAEDDPDWQYSFYGAVKFPVVYGNMENTNSHPTGTVDASIFDKQPVINAITRIKEFVGYLFRIDMDGAARFEPPNFWTTGNFLDDGTHVPPSTKMYVVDEEKQLTDYTVSFNDESIVSEIVISSFEPTSPLDDTVTTHYLTPNADLLRGMVRPWAWTNETFTTKDDQRRMAEILSVHFWFAQRLGAVKCPANPAIDVDDQIMIFERTTSETTIHYVRGTSTNMDLETGDYDMTITTNWLGTPEEWQAVANFRLSNDIADWLNSTDASLNRANPSVEETGALEGKVTRGGGFELHTDTGE